ncbi:MAG: hypothetical protein WKG07_29650 [Hymenobacter sp.]
MIFFALAKKQVSISAVELNDGRVRLTRTAPDSGQQLRFHHQAPLPTPRLRWTPRASGLKYNIGKARLTNIYFTQDDQITGSDLRAAAGRGGRDDGRGGRGQVHLSKVDEATLQRASILINQTKTGPRGGQPRSYQAADAAIWLEARPARQRELRV